MASTSLAAELQARAMYDLLPQHGKVVTLDADLPVKHALDALASHGAGGPAEVSSPYEPASVLVSRI